MPKAGERGLDWARLPVIATLGALLFVSECGDICIPPGNQPCETSFGTLRGRSGLSSEFSGCRTSS